MRYVVILCFLLVSFFGCGEKVEILVSSPKLLLSIDTVYTAKQKEISELISFENIDQMSRLVVRKITKNQNVIYNTLMRSSISKTVVFNYQVNDYDEEIFNFSFEVIDLDGQKTSSKTLWVENRDGIIPYDLVRISRVTGKTLPGEILPNPNKTDELYDVGGVDLGIMWDMDNGKIGLFFGDTFGKDFKPSETGGGGGGNWRSNVLAFSDDKNLNDGISFNSMAISASGYARQIIYSAHDKSGIGDFSSIPTAAIRANGRDYVHYMNIKQWGTDGQWSTNYSGLYSSSDNGNNWEKCPSIYFPSHSNFSQVAYCKKDGFIYMLGTISGRYGDAFLARFLENNILIQSEYEYWNSANGWMKADENRATPIFKSPVGELSLSYNTKYNRWITTYLDMVKHALVIRDAPQITGPWSNVKTLASSSEYPGHYGAFIYPFKNDGDELYFLMSIWVPYNVFLMKTRLKLI